MRYILFLIVVLGLAACGTTGSGGTQTSLLQVESVEPRVAESYPVQVFVNVKGTLQDGCTSLGTTTQQRQGSTITVTITTNRTQAEACTLIAQLVDENIRLEGEFPSGTYTVVVNGVQATFTT